MDDKLLKEKQLNSSKKIKPSSYLSKESELEDSLDAPVINTTRIPSSRKSLNLLSQEERPNEPEQYQSELPKQSAPEEKIIYKEKKKRSVGCGIFGRVFRKIYNFVGCLLLIASLVIIGLIVWLNF